MQGIVGKHDLHKATYLTKKIASLLFGSSFFSVILNAAPPPGR